MSLQAEQIDHINIINWFNHEFPDLEEDFHHFANERKCSVMQGRTLKRMGVKKGVLDFFLALPANGKYGLWLELKVGKNQPTAEQKDFAWRKMMRGYEVSFVWGFEEAKVSILSYLENYISERDKFIQKNMMHSGPIC
jgi:hypothetical protein